VFQGDAAALILKMSVKKIAKIYPRQGAASKMFCDGGAISSLRPFEFSKIGKFASLGLNFYSK
jgi:hypothetical protein